MDTNFEIIEKYIDGELVGQELINFEKLLESNADIKRNYQLSLEINNSILEDDIMLLRENLDFMYKNEPKVKRLPNSFTRRKFYYAAASAALLLASGGIIKYITGSDLDNVAVFEKYYTPYEVAVIYRSGNAEVDRILLNALQKYEEKDFGEALILFEKVLKSGKDDLSVNLYSGISYIEEEKFNNAANSFEKIIANNDNLFIEQAKWYLAMCYIITEKTDEAELILKELIKSESYYKSQSAKVLKDLNVKLKTK